MTDAKDTIRIAVIGTGAISQVVHVPIFTEREDVDLVALADSDIPKAESVAKRFGIDHVCAPEEVFESHDLDAIAICTPNDTHEDMAIRGLRAGLHVFVERPLASTSAGAQRVIDAATEAGKSLVVGLPHRFRPEVSALRSFVAGGELGRLYAIRGSWLTRRVPVLRPTWRQNRSAGGGALIDLGVPALDLCLWIVGFPKIKRVTCVMHAGEFEVEDAATLMFESVEGVAFSIEVSSSFFAGEDRYYARVMGSEGSGSLPPLEIYKQLGGRPLEVTPTQPRPRGGENPYMNAYRRLLDHFVRVVNERVDAELPTHQVALMQLIEAAFVSAETGKEVEL